VVSLYVNQHNAPAVGAYRKVGFTQTAEFQTVRF
jgi:predicted GNAT family acetyltransferase